MKTKRPRNHDPKLVHLEVVSEKFSHMYKEVLITACGQKWEHAKRTQKLEEVTCKSCQKVYRNNKKQEATDEK